MPLFCIVFLEYNYSKGTTEMKAKTILLLLLVTLFLFTGAIACDSGNNAPTEQQEQTSDAAATENDLISFQDIGQGATVFKFQMIDDERNISSWNVHTDESTVGEALVKVGLIEGDVSDFGIMVSHVNGIRADFEEDGAWWAFWIDDEMAMVGVDSTEIEEGVTYAFIYTPA